MVANTGKPGFPPIFLAVSGDIPDLDAVDFAAGVGLIRSEYVLRRAGHYVTTRQGRDALGSYVRTIAQRFSPKPVWLRTSDFEAREIATLSGCDSDEVDENPILGDRGVRRGQRFPATFRQELSIAAEIGPDCPNLGLLFSYVPDVEALDFACQAACDAGWRGPLGAMIETPSAVRVLDQFLRRSLSFFVLGMNDLTSLVLGTARTSRFTRKDHPIVLDMVREVVDRVQHAGVPILLAGNFNADEFAVTARLPVDGLILHHYELPSLLPDRFSSVADMHVVPTIKAQTAALLAKRAAGHV